MKKARGRSGFLAVCIAPAVILFFVFMILPTLNVFRMSLFEKGAYSPNEAFVGLKNFKTLISDTNFIRSMQNMILLIVVVTIVTFAFALVFAGILSREKIRGQNFFRIIFYIPNILSVVVIAGIFSAIYKPENGMLNSIISLFHKMENPILWKGESLVMVSLIIAMVWQAIGYYMVMYMASMASVPESLYESAGLDGAGRMVQFFQITIPLIWTNIRTTLTFFIISTINMAFLFVKAMTSGGPNGSPGNGFRMLFIYPALSAWILWRRLREEDCRCRMKVRCLLVLFPGSNRDKRYWTFVQHRAANLCTQRIYWQVPV